MTNKKAIDYLNDLKMMTEHEISEVFGMWYKGIKDDHDTVLDMAIEVLSKDTNVFSNDTISRQAAIDACHNYEDGKEAYAYGYVVEERLQCLPSAQPDTIPVDWIQKYADDWEDMNYACENPILGMLEDWRDEQDE